MPSRPTLFSADPVDEVPLLRAPLVRVIAQVRFPEQLEVDRREVIEPIQGAIRERYPVLRQESIHVARGEGPQSVHSSTAWRFFDRTNTWRATLTTGFLALETWRYTSRADLVQRLVELSEAVATHIGPSRVDRLGVRYIDRIVNPELANVGRLLHSDVLGVAANIPTPTLVHTMNEALLQDLPALLLARWGYLPPNATYDPAALESIESSSWVLDIDVHRTNGPAFSPDWIRDEASALAARAYRFFRWAVTDEFLECYGGDV